MVGGLDPLLDDSVDFNTRIRRVGVQGDLFIHRTLPHSYFSFPPLHAMSEVREALRLSCELLDALCNHAPGGAGRVSDDLL